MEGGFKMVAWDAERIKQEFGELIDTPRMTSIDVRFTASMDEVPEFTYTIKQYSLPEGK